MLDALVYADNFSSICCGPPQYKHRRFAQHLHFLASDNGPCTCAALISIGMGLFTKMGLSACIGVVDGATTTKVYTLPGLCDICWCLEHRSSTRLSHHMAQVIACVKDIWNQRYNIQVTSNIICNNKEESVLVVGSWIMVYNLLTSIGKGNMNYSTNNHCKAHSQLCRWGILN